MKQAIVARADLGMGAGKLAAQVAHASLRAAGVANDPDRDDWTAAGATKVVLRGTGEEHLLDLAAAAERAGLPYAVVRDAGRTQLEPGTVTALAVGPAPDAAVDRITGNLDLY